MKFGSLRLIVCLVFASEVVLPVPVLQGFSVDYVLHIAHKYNEAHQYHSSFLKMRDAITSIGPSIISASITTTGSSIFLVFCQIYIFQQMGWLLIVNTVFAIGVAMLTFPSILSLIGPRGRCCDIYGRCSRKPNNKTTADTQKIEMVAPPRVDKFLVSHAENDAEFSVLPPSPLQHHENRPDDQPMPGQYHQKRPSASNALASFNVYENAYAPVENNAAAVQNDDQPMPDQQPLPTPNHASASLNVHNNAHPPAEINVAAVQNDDQPMASPHRSSSASNALASFNIYDNAYAPVENNAAAVEDDDQPMPDQQPS